MKSTSRGCRKSRRWILAIILCAHLWILPPLCDLWAQDPGKRDLILVEFSHRDLDERAARGYFDAFKQFFRKELSLEPVNAASLRVKEDGIAELSPVPIDTLFLWREKLGQGKKFFKNLQLDEGTAELRELIDAPYRYHLDEKARDLVKEATLSYSFILFKTGDRKGSEKLVSRYAYLSGKKDISDQVYPPDFVNFYHDISRKHHFITLAINSTPTGARIFFGKDVVGETPLVKKMEKFGPITLSVRKRGYREHVIRRFVLPGDRLTFDLDLEIDEISEIEHSVHTGDYEGVAANLLKLNSRMNIEAGLAAVLKGDRESNSIDYIFVTGENEGSKENVSIYRNIPKGKAHFSRKDLEPLLEDELFLSIVPPDGKTKLLDEGLKKKRLTERWWFWALLGAGAAGVVYAISKGSDNKSSSSVNVEF